MGVTHLRSHGAVAVNHGNGTQVQSLGHAAAAEFNEGYQIHACTPEILTKVTHVTAQSVAAVYTGFYDI